MLNLSPKAAGEKKKKLGTREPSDSWRHSGRTPFRLISSMLEEAGGLGIGGVGCIAGSGFGGTADQRVVTSCSEKR